MKYTFYLACAMSLGVVSIDAAEGIQQPAQQESFCARMCARVTSCIESPVALKQTLVTTLFLCATEAGIGLPYEDMVHVVYIPVVASCIGGAVCYRVIKRLPPIAYKYIVGIGLLARSGAWAGSKVSMDLGAAPKFASFSGLASSLVGTFAGGLWAKCYQDAQERRELEEALIESEQV